MVPFSASSFHGFHPWSKSFGPARNLAASWIDSPRAPKALLYSQLQGRRVARLGRVGPMLQAKRGGGTGGGKMAADGLLK